MPELDLGNVKGPQGKSAYQSALDAGYSGSEEAFNTAMAKAPDAVLYTAQSLTDEQKAQVRTNINAAPGGFGLGTEAVNVPGGRDANNLSGCGFFRADQNTPTSDWWYGYQIEYGAGYKYQRFGRTDNFEIVERKQINNVWGDWEYLNPPMKLGVEYRTTERCLGRPVYVKAVDCSPLTDGKSVPHGITDLNFIFYAQGTRGSSPLPLIYNHNLSDPWSCYISSIDRTNIVLRAGSSAANANSIVILKYTKTTD